MNVLLYENLLMMTTTEDKNVAFLNKQGEAVFIEYLNPIYELYRLIIYVIFSFKSHGVY